MLKITMRCDNNIMFLIGFIVVVLSTLSMLVWRNMPVYPDEIALRVHLGNFIQNKGVVNGLFPVCTDNIKQTPFLFILPAWLFSKVNLALNPSQIRILPLVSTLSLVCITIICCLKGKVPSVFFIILASFLGVASSGLVLARYEFAQVLNLSFCFAGIYVLSKSHINKITGIILSVFIYLSALFSCYIHLQGLLFLPFSIFIMYRLINRSKIISIILLMSLFLLTVYITLSFQKFHCKNLQEVEKLINSLVLNKDDITKTDIISFFISSMKGYLSNFLYKANYAIGYLPPVDISSKFQNIFYLVVNRSIQLLLLINLTLICFISISPLIPFVFTKMEKINNLFELSLQDHIAFCLVSSPIVLLFIYDPGHNFYRAFFMNLIISSVLAIYLSRMRCCFLYKLINYYAGIISVVFCISVALNMFSVTPKINNGYVGPSFPLNSNWTKIDANVKALASSCNINVSSGRLIIDDYTFNSLKYNSHLYAVTYLELSKKRQGFSTDHLVKILQPQAAITRCDYLDALGIKAQQRIDDLCCACF